MDINEQLRQKRTDRTNFHGMLAMVIIFGGALVVYALLHR